MLSNCSGTRRQTSGRHEQVVYDSSPIAVESLPSDAAVRQHILYMPFGEAALRLGSLKFAADNRFVFTTDTREYEQSDHSEIAQDTSGNSHLRIKNGSSQIETYAVDNRAYIRSDVGHLREQSTHSVDIETWQETAFSGLGQMLEIFGRRVMLTPQDSPVIEKRQTQRFRVKLAPVGEESPGGDSLTPYYSRLPIAPVASWREQAQPLDLTGAIWVDNETGVVLKAELDGRVQIRDRKVRPTQLELHFKHEISDIGRVATITVPESTQEFRRKPVPSDPLSFFRDHLPDLPK